MEEKYHKELHERLGDRIANNEKRLTNHSDRIKILESQTIRTETIIENLCKEVAELVSTIKWGGGILITTLIGFFIWYIQNIK